MGSILFDFLTESVLFDKGHLENQYADLQDGEILAELERYREFCLSNREELIAEAAGAKPSAFKVFPGVHSINSTLLKQSALYVERYVISDPLFPLTQHDRQYDKVMRSYFGQDDPHQLDRVQVAERVGQLKKLTPMVAGNYVKILPVSFLFEAPEHIPLYHSENRFSEVLPPELLALFHRNKKIQQLKRDRAGWITDPTQPLSRAIAIEFGDDYSAGMVYQLFEQEVESLDEASRTFKVRLTFPDTLPDQATYDAWIEQSINRTAINYYDRLCTELALSLQLGASYLCFSEFRNALLSQYFPVRISTPEHSASVVLQLNLPFLDEIDTQTLMSVRRNDGEAFQAFRHELERQFWDLRMEDDPEKLRIKAEKVVHELGTVQHETLTRNLTQLRRGSLAGTVILSAAFSGTFLAGGHYVPALVGTAAGIYKLKSDYDAALRQNPSFFLWKVRRSSR